MDIKRKKQKKELAADSAERIPLVNEDAESNPDALDPEYEKKKKKKKFKLKLLKIGMCAVLALGLLVGVLLLVMPLFHVKEIVVEGNDRYYTAEQIIETSGIQVGDEIFSVAFSRSNGEVSKKLFSACPALKTVRVSCGISKVTIEVTEMKNMMYCAVGEGWYAFNGDLRVTERSSSEKHFEHFMKVKFPKISGVSIGQQVEFIDPSINYDYIKELLAVLEEQNILDRVTYIDFSNKLYLSCVFGDQIRLNFGSMADMDHKLEEFGRILRKKGSDEYAVIDVSVKGQESYRVVQKDELYQ